MYSSWCESFKYDMNFNYCNISLYTIKQIQIRVLGRRTYREMLD